MPFDNRTADKAAAYQRVIGSIQSTVDGANTDKVICLGDFNADPHKGRFWTYVSDFAGFNCFTVSDLSLPPETFSYFLLKPLP